MKKLVVFSGAGISADSGITTFRDSDGLWENYNIEEVATPEAWKQNPSLVLEFYNKRREQVNNAEPNAAHKALAKLEKYFDVQIITQNIDDLHERAGSTNILHLHGEINKAKSSKNHQLLYDITGRTLALGQKAEDGAQLRPHVVWFGEDVPNMSQAFNLIKDANIVIVVGTSLTVHPAASLIHYAKHIAPKYLVDPKSVEIRGVENLTVIQKKASEGIPTLAYELIEKYSSS